MRQGRALVEGVSAEVHAGEHWAVIGPNGAGKSTLLALCGAKLHPTSGTVHVLGHRLGRVDMRELRTHIGHIDPRTRIEADLTVREAVLTGLVAASDLPARWAPAAADTALADELTATLGLTARTDTRWSVLSQGERGRVLIARALMTRPQLLLLDEPTTGLDLAAREILLDVLSGLREAHPRLSSLLVTHHLEELPASTTHALVIADGRVLASGPAAQVLTSATITGAFGYPIAVERRAGRWTASSAVTGRRDDFAGNGAGIVQIP
ncbi:ABC transporter ATP-binding protein [Tomitella cavernea]|nr:ATP-binding cassette domain-containing protein [Tomitella cavernea]